MPVLIAFAGLPGAGKSTIARAVARHLGAAYLRIDTVEQALRAGGTLPAGVVAEGYAVAYAVAADQLALGLSVVADAVNPLRLTRDAWRAVADRAGVPLVDVEVVCSDAAEHRRRVETRTIDVPGLVLPTWEAVRPGSTTRGTGRGSCSTPPPAMPAPACGSSWTSSPPGAAPAGAS